MSVEPTTSVPRAIQNIRGQVSLMTVTTKLGNGLLIR